MGEPELVLAAHAAWMDWLRPEGADRKWALLGAMAPDLPAVAAGGVELARGGSPEALAERIYRRRPWPAVHRVAHSLWPLLTLIATERGDPRRRRFAEGYLSHLAIDYLTHHDDAWPPLWPLSGWRWRAPVSYWQTEHHAPAVRLIEMLPAFGWVDRRPATSAAMLAAVAAAHWPARPSVAA